MRSKNQDNQATRITKTVCKINNFYIFFIQKTTISRAFISNIPLYKMLVKKYNEFEKIDLFLVLPESSYLCNFSKNKHT